MALQYTTVRPCRTKSGYEAILEDPLELDLDTVEGKLQQRGCQTINAGVLLVITLATPGLPEVHLYPSGRLLIKTDQAPLALKAANLLAADLDLATST